MSGGQRWQCMESEVKFRISDMGYTAETSSDII